LIDGETVLQALSGDEGAQRALYETHYVPAFRLACLLLQDMHDAEEVVQDAFVYVLCNLHRYDSNRGSFWAWLRVILVSRCHNKRRRRQRHLLSLEGLDAAAQPSSDPQIFDPASVLERMGIRRVVWEALQQISPAARNALVLRYYEGLPYAEIAETLNCSQDAARARVAYGKVQLRRLLVASKDGEVRGMSVARAAKAA
jgi:RNA polymerase sigma-70 factor (ECF subfamily)